LAEKLVGFVCRTAFPGCGVFALRETESEGRKHGQRETFEGLFGFMSCESSALEWLV
jgi:hypothetical protein